MAEPQPVVRSKPVADQVTDILRERIIEGAYPPDQRMPSETQLSAEFGVSRSSLRTALASLAAEGQIRRRHGDGTYPCPPNFRLTLRSGRHWDIERQIENSGRRPSMRVLERRRRSPTPDEFANLELGKGEKLLSIRRLFLADGDPVALISSYISAVGLAAKIPASEAAIPPQRFLELYHERKPRGGTMRFSAISADEAIAALLGVPRGSPLLGIEGVYRDAGRRALMLVSETYRGQEGFELNTGLLGP